MGQFDEALAKLAAAAAALERLHEFCTNRNERAVVHQRATGAVALIADAVKMLSEHQRHKDESHQHAAEKPAIPEKPAAGKKP